MADKRDLLINLLGRETVSPAAKKAAAGIEDVADEMGDAARAAGKLDRQIDDLKRSLAALAVQSALTGDVDVTKQIRVQERELRRLTKDRSLIGSMAKLGSEAGEAAGKTTIRTFGETLSALPSQVKGAGIIAGVALGAAMAPAIGAAISGAILAGVGAGGIGAGVALAFQDDRVKKAAEGLGAQVKKSFTSAASGFVGPVLASIKMVGDSSARIAGQAKGAFNDLAPLVTTLTKGVLGLAENAMPGFRDAVKAAAPIIRTLARELPELGADISHFFKKISGDADGATMGIHGMLEFIGASIRTLGDVIAWLSDKWEKFVNFTATASGKMEDAWGGVPIIGDRFRELNDRAENLQQGLKEAGDTSGDTAGDFSLLGGKAAAAAVEVETLAEMIDRVTGENLSAEQSNIRLEEAIDAATAAGKRNNDGIDVNTEKGRANRSLLLDLAAAAKANATDILTMTGSTQQASAASERGRAAFIKAALAMGVEKGEAKRLADMLFGIPDEVNTRANLDKAAAERKIKGLLDWIDRIPSSKTITVNVRAGQRSGVGGLGGLPFSHGGRVEGPGPKGVDSVPILAARGEHVLTAREVDAAGGHRAIERWRKSLASGVRQPVAASTGAIPAASSAPSFTSAQLAAAFRSAIAGLSVQLDGRTVGYIQGRQADLYARGG